MPILVAAGVSQLNRSTGVTLVGQAPVADLRRFCSRRIAPQAPNQLPVGTFAIADVANTTVSHLGVGVHVIEKVSGTPASYDASAVSAIGTAGNFALRLTSPDDAGNFAGVTATPLVDNSSTMDFSWQLYNGGYRAFEGAIDRTGFLAIPIYAWIWRLGPTLYFGRGATLAAAQAAPDYLVANSATLYFDSTLHTAGNKIEAWFYELGASTTLQADAATFVMTGNNANLNAVRRLTANAGSYALSGQTAALQAVRRLTANLATYSINGQSAGLNAQRRLTADTGSFTITGQSAFLTRAVPLIALPASYAMAGQSAVLSAQREIILDPGSFAMAGQSASLDKQYRLALQTGVFAMAGQNAILAYSGIGSASTRPRVTAFFYR